MKIRTTMSWTAVASICILCSCQEERQTATTEIASPVSVTEVTTGSIKKYNSTSGTVYSMSEVTLNSEMAGKYILQTNPRTGKPYKLGDKVNTGDIIVKFINQEYENDIAIDSKKLSLEIAEQEEINKRDLYEKGGVTLSELRNGEISIANAKYSYENAKLSLDKMNIRAPFDGVITDLPHYTSSVNLSSGSAIATIMSYQKMIMEINLPESAIGEVVEGQGVDITHYTLPNDTVSGVISELSPAISTETRTFKGKLLINNSELLLRPGMFVKADIVVDKSDSTIIVPKEIVMSNRYRKYVYVAEMGLAKRRDIKTGLEDKDYIEVTDGLEIGEQLITRGYETLRDNSKIKIQK